MKVERHDGVIVLFLDELDFLEHLDATLRLRGLGGLVAEAIDEGLRFLDGLALVPRRLPKSLAACLAFFQIEGEIAGKLLGAAVMEGDGARDERVQQRDVVRDDADGSAVIA